MGEEIIYVTDMSRCLPTGALSTESKKGCWTLMDFETDSDQTEHIRGTLVYACKATASPEIRLPLNVEGEYEIYVGTCQTIFEGEGVRLKLSGDSCYARVSSEKCLPKDGTFPDKSFLWADLTESFWRVAELSGQDLLIAPPPQAADLGAFSNLAYLKLVPVTAERARAWDRLAPRAGTKRLVAVFDTCGPFTTWYPTSTEQLGETFEPFRSSDFEMIMYPMARTDLCRYPTKVGQMITEDLDFFHTTFRKAGACIEDLVTQGIDPLRVGIDWCSDMGVSIYPTMRLAGPHTPPLHASNMSEFFCRRQDLWCRGPGGEHSPHLSFAFPEVQDRLLAVMREMAEYGGDGLGILFNRGTPYALYEQPVLESFQDAFGEDPRELPPTDERWMRHKAGFLTEFVRQLRALLDELGGQRGLRLGLAVYTVTDPVSSLFRAVDVESYLREGLVDHLIIHPHGSAPQVPGATDSLAGVSQFKALAERSGCRVYADVYPRRMPAWAYLERARAFYDAGADGMCYWDCDGRTSRLSEWAVARLLGHKEEVYDWPLDVRKWFTVLPTRSLAGLWTDASYGTLTNG